MVAVTTIVVYCTCFVCRCARLATTCTRVGIIPATAARMTCIPTEKEPHESKANTAKAIGVKKAYYSTPRIQVPHA